MDAYHLAWYQFLVAFCAPFHYLWVRRYFESRCMPAFFDPNPNRHWLARHNHRVVVYNRTREKALALADEQLNITASEAYVIKVKGYFYALR